MIFDFGGFVIGRSITLVTTTAVLRPISVSALVRGITSPSILLFLPPTSPMTKVGGEELLGRLERLVVAQDLTELQTLLRTPLEAWASVTTVDLQARSLVNHLLLDQVVQN